LSPVLAAAFVDPHIFLRGRTKRTEQNGTKRKAEGKRERQREKERERERKGGGRRGRIAIDAGDVSAFARRGRAPVCAIPITSGAAILRDLSTSLNSLFDAFGNNLDEKSDKKREVVRSRAARALPGRRDPPGRIALDSAACGKRLQIRRISAGGRCGNRRRGRDGNVTRTETEERQTQRERERERERGGGRSRERESRTEKSRHAGIP